MKDISTDLTAGIRQLQRQLQEHLDLFSARSRRISLTLPERGDGRLAGLGNYALPVPHGITARIQEAHILHSGTSAVEAECA